jgi:prepilin-type processing-associated H-X9-DG protein
MLPRSNYAAVFGTSDPDASPGDQGEGAFVENRGVRFGEVVRGLSQIVLVGERTTRKLPSSWYGFVVAGEDAPGRVTGHLFRGPNRDDADECEYDSRHPGHVNFVWADGHATSVSDDVDQCVYRLLAHRN